MTKDRLDMFDEARAMVATLKLCGITQDELAERLGVSQSYVANKLRLLKLPEDVLEKLRLYGLSERHGRALLRLNDADSQRLALEHIHQNAMTVAAAEEYIDALLSSPAEEEKLNAKRMLVLKDVRIFLNSLKHSLELMKQGGIAAGVEKQETEDRLILTISIPKNKNGQ